MKNILLVVKSVLKDSRGATAIEYALIASAFGLGTAAAMPLMTSRMNATYDQILNYFSSI